MARARAREVARHEVEAKLYADIGIPTIQVAADELNPIIVANLRQVLLWQRRSHGLDESQQDLALEAFHVGLEAGVPPLETLYALEQSEGLDPYSTKAYLYWAIWHRKVRVDLCQWLFVDQPLVAETQDVLQIHGEWFARGTR